MSSSPQNTPKHSAAKLGLIAGIFTYVVWGSYPIYFKNITQVPALEILAHRIVWSVPFGALIIALRGQWGAVFAAFRHSKTCRALIAASLFIAFNWGVYIWAVNNDHLLDASLGYFINPLFSVALGVIFLGERLRKWQILAVTLAIIGVLIQLIYIGSLPIISLALAGTFGIYGLLRKKLPIDSFIGLLVESALMLPIALIYWQFFVSSETSNMLNNAMSLNVTLLFAGIVTTAPLLCFTAAAKRLTLSTVGFFQYIGPSIMFILATVYYQEILVVEKLITFAFIWTALLIYSFDSFKAHKQKKRLRALEEAKV